MLRVRLGLSSGSGFEDSSFELDFSAGVAIMHFSVPSFHLLGSCGSRGSFRIRWIFRISLWTCLLFFITFGDFFAMLLILIPGPHRIILVRMLGSGFEVDGQWAFSTMGHIVAYLFIFSAPLSQAIAGVLFHSSTLL